MQALSDALGNPSPIAKVPSPQHPIIPSPGTVELPLERNAASSASRTQPLSNAWETVELRTERSTAASASRTQPLPNAWGKKTLFTFGLLVGALVIGVGALWRQASPSTVATLTAPPMPELTETLLGLTTAPTAVIPVQSAIATATPEPPSTGSAHSGAAAVPKGTKAHPTGIGRLAPTAAPSVNIYSRN